MTVIQSILLLLSLRNAIYAFERFMGMHNNTFYGNSFGLLIPFATFDKDQFADRGNYWRFRYNPAFVLAVIILIPFFGVTS